MPSDESKFYRKLFVTNHRKQLNKLVKERLADVTGSVLLLGVGHTDYSRYFNLDKCSVLQTDLEYYGPHVTMLVDVHNLVALGREFDAVIAFEVFEHINNLGNAVDQIHAVLKPNGILLASMPFMFHIHADPDDYVRLTRRGIECRFSKFNNTHVRGFGNRIHVVLDLVTTLNKPMASLRILNHLLIGRAFSFASIDSPSGYFFECKK